jgi:hypothetical protein
MTYIEVFNRSNYNVLSWKNDELTGFLVYTYDSIVMLDKSFKDLDNIQLSLSNKQSFYGSLQVAGDIAQILGSALMILTVISHRRIFGLIGSGAIIIQARSAYAF